jgi:hypothetical protein
LLATANKDKRFIKFFPALLFFSFLFCFYSLVVPISSGGAGFTRSSMSLIPILVIIAIDMLDRAVSNKFVVVITILLIVNSSFDRSIQSAYEQLDENAKLGQEMERLSRLLHSQEVDGEEEIVIMTRNPWQVNYSTKYMAIQIPNEDLETIYSVALKYGADYLLLPAPREALVEIYNDTRSDERFVFIAKVPGSDLKLYKIEGYK